MKKLYFTLTLIFVFLFSFSQSGLRIAQNSNNQSVNNRTELAQANSENELENSINRPELNQSPFDAVREKKEIPSKRNQYSKTYQNEDGSFTALIGAGPIHYDNNGVWEDIDTKIIPNGNENFPYKNTTNLFASYYGATAHKGIKSVTAEGEVLEFQNVKMAWEVNGQTVNNTNAANSSVTINNDIATYPNLFGNISAELTSLVGKRELNYVIPNAQALSNAPANAEYLVFTEEIALPINWIAISTEKGIEVKNNNGEVIYLYPKPVSTDANSTLMQEENTIYEMHQNGSILTLKTKVKTEWLLSEERVFPVKVDPTVNCFVNNNGVSTTGVVNSIGFITGLNDDLASGYGPEGIDNINGYAKYNISAIPIGSTISNAISWTRVTSNNTYTGNGHAWASCFVDPQTASGTAIYQQGTSLYWNANPYQSTGNLSQTLNATARTDIQNALNQGWFAMLLYPIGPNWYYNEWMQVKGRTGGTTTGDSNQYRPYLSITYTAPAGPPSCATLIGPQNNATGIGQSGLIAWNPVGGATNYDVYFGTAANPPLVSSNQGGTTYTVGPCLLPNTTYYWKVIAKNANGSATGCSTWKFTTDGKLHIYQNNFNDANPGVFGTSGASVDGWYANNNSATGGAWNNGYNNAWTVGNGPNVIDGYSVGVSALYNGGLGGNYFQYWSDLGEIHRWIYRPFDMRGLRDIEVSFRWKAGGEANEDYGSVATSINGGANWLTDNQGGLNSDGKYWNSPSTIRSQTLVFPDTRNNQQNFQLAFKWDDLSGNGNSLDPSFVVDDIVIKACPYEGVISSNVVGSGIFEWNPTGSTQAVLNVNGSHQCAQYQWEQSTNNGVSWTDVVGGSGATTSIYTTPSNLTVNTWYRAKVYYGTGCIGAYQDDVFKINFSVPLNCSPLSNLNVQLGDPFNGLNHHIDVSWDALTGATEYDIQYSTDGTNFSNASPASVSTNFASLNMGDYPNERYWFRVRAKSASETCDWTYSDPIYTACDVPELPNLTNAFGTSLDLTIQPELPVANPSHTEYAIVCETTGQYVQADGSLGSNPVWQTNAQWGTMTVSGLTASTNYCFYLLARNGDGHIVGAPENSGNTLITQTFDSNILTTGSSAPTNTWFAPNSKPQIAWNNTEGCPSGGGSIGYNANWNNFWGNFVRLPAQNFTGVDEAVMTFDLTNSFTAGQTDNNFRLYIHDGGSYQNPPTVVEVGGNTYTQQGINNYFYLFDEARTCEEVTVTYDISGIANKSTLLFYIEVNSGYNNSNPFFFYIDNITLSEAIESSVPSECVTLGVAPTPTFYDYGGGMQLNFNNSKLNQDKAVFRLSHPGSTAATKYEIQVSPNVDFTGTPWSHVYTDNYTAQTQANFTFDETEGNLIDGATYYVRARVDVGEGWGAWTTKTYSFTYVTDDIVEWFQTTTPQFVTGILDNVESTNDEARQIVSGGGGSNPVTNGNFASNLNGWTVTIPYGTSNMKAERIGATDSYCSGTCDPLPGTTNLRMGSPDFGTATNNFNGESIIVAQQVNLTGIDEISFDVAAYYNLGNPSYNNANTVLKFVIGGTLTNATGDATTIQTQPASYSYSGVSTRTIDVSGYSGNQVIKFVLTYNNSWHGNGAIRYYIGGVGSNLGNGGGGIVGVSSPFGTGSITSPAIYKSSFPTTESNYYTELYWTQEIHSSLVMAMQRYDGGSSSWVDVAGYDNITFPTSGAKTYDISGMTAYDSIRIKATMEGSNQVKLFDWGVRLDKSTPLPVKLLNFNAICSDNKINFSWSTASEINSDCFEIIETKDFVNFNSLAKIYAAGFSSQTIIYNYQAKANYGKTYYQLKQYDVDGNWEILSTIVANCEDNFDNEIYVYPNPNNGNEIIVSLNSIIDDAIIMVYDAAGRLVRRFEYKEFGKENILKFRPKLEPGIYVLELNNSKIKYKYLKFIVN